MMSDDDDTIRFYRDIRREGASRPCLHIAGAFWPDIEDGQVTFYDYSGSQTIHNIDIEKLDAIIDCLVDFRDECAG